MPAGVTSERCRREPRTDMRFHNEIRGSGCNANIDYEGERKWPLKVNFTARCSSRILVSATLEFE